MKRMQATDSTTGLQYGEAYCQLGDVYKDSENIGLALQAYLQGIQLSPSYDAGFCNFFYTATFACHWKKRSQHLKHLRLVMKKYLRGPDPLTHECVQPFQSLAYPLEPEELLEIATFHARKAAVHVQGLVGRQFVPLPHVQSLLTVSSARGGGLHRKLRIGFVSADYKDHPVVKDLIHMFSSFDRSNFDIFCFALNPAAGPVGWEVQGWHEDGGPGPHRLWRDRAAKHCNLVDVSGDRDPEAASVINDKRMHVLFNIMGYTQGERNEIFALQVCPRSASGISAALSLRVGTPSLCYSVLRRAPPLTRARTHTHSQRPCRCCTRALWAHWALTISATWSRTRACRPLSSPATMPSTLSTCRTRTSSTTTVSRPSSSSPEVCPVSVAVARALCSSLILGSLGTDTLLSLATFALARSLTLEEDDAPIERDLYGLPRDASVIYCNFNQQYKVDAPTLKAWVQILMRVPGSIMWLIRFGTSNAAEETLRAEALQMGLDDDTRIVFTDPTPRRIHLHVKALADVFVDTPQYNGHGTATDALWAGIPLVTFPVRKMASRAATSFVYASAGQGRATLTRTMKDMVDTAVRLGQQRLVLSELRRQLTQGRFESPMFDTKRWVVSFQKALRMLWEDHVHSGEWRSTGGVRRANVVLADVVPPFIATPPL